MLACIRLTAFERYNEPFHFSFEFLVIKTSWKGPRAARFKVKTILNFRSKITLKVKIILDSCFEGYARQLVGGCLTRWPGSRVRRPPRYPRTSDLQNMVISLPFSTNGNGVWEKEAKGNEGMKGLTLEIPIGAIGAPFGLCGAKHHRKWPKLFICDCICVAN